MEMQAVTLDDSVGLPGVVPNETRLVKSPRQQNLGEVPDQVDNSLGEHPANTDLTAIEREKPVYPSPPRHGTLSMCFIQTCFSVVVGTFMACSISCIFAMHKYLFAFFCQLRVEI